MKTRYLGSEPKVNFDIEAHKDASYIQKKITDSIILIPMGLLKGNTFEIKEYYIPAQKFTYSLPEVDIDALDAFMKACEKAKNVPLGFCLIYQNESKIEFPAEGSIFTATEEKAIEDLTNRLLMNLPDLVLQVCWRPKGLRASVYSPYGDFMFDNIERNQAYVTENAAQLDGLLKERCKPRFATTYNTPPAKNEPITPKTKSELVTQNLSLDKLG